jgi:hypothetical protein
MIKEQVTLARLYEERSVAEQNSFDLAWRLLMDEEFSEFRSTLCSSPAELSRFRALVVNAVMATDLGDKKLKELRSQRWDRAFAAAKGASSHKTLDQTADRNRKATIVVEHLIQASDVCHTMQHWEVYREWNENLFMEMYAAYKAGRSEKNPADFWYKGEIGFFDFYIVPLSQKLKECGVFGVSSDEFLNYALENRSRWVEHGEETVNEFLQKAHAHFDVPGVNEPHPEEDFPHAEPAEKAPVQVQAHFNVPSGKKPCPGETKLCRGEPDRFV